ncbi:hypothetical protein LCGC14_1626890 [marine sediment metagenome]|uniref:Uncharacterized protein n=1 Tax=marine sediment metagenome TaxID=412755 RepID=A0A0F9L3H5_9ZZZZ
MIKAISIPGFLNVASNASLDEWVDWIKEYDINIDVPEEEYDILYRMLYREQPSYSIAVSTSVLTQLNRNLKRKNYQMPPCELSLDVSLNINFFKFVHGFLNQNYNEPIVLLLSHIECGDLITDNSCACSSLKPCDKIRVIHNIDDLKTELVNLWNIQVKAAINRTFPSRRGRTEDSEYYSKIFLEFLNNNDLQYKYLINVEALSDKDILQEMQNLGMSNLHRVDLLTIHSDKEMIFIEAKSNSNFNSLEEKFRCTEDFVEKFKNYPFPALKAIGIIHQSHFIPNESHICRNRVLFKKISTKQEKIVTYHNICWHMFKEQDLRNF